MAAKGLSTAPRLTPTALRDHGKGPALDSARSGHGEHTPYRGPAPQEPGGRRPWIGGLLLIGIVLGTASAFASWKYGSIQETAAASANQPEPAEVVTAAVATERAHRPTTTAIGTVLAMRSITLRNELPGTVREVNLVPGEIVEKGDVLVALDVSVEEAELEALRAQAALAQTTLDRIQHLTDNRAASQMELDQAIAERDVALAQIERLRAIIERKTIRAPFRARVGIADVHPGQYLGEGTLLTTLQGVDDGAHVDFAVEQDVASGLRDGDEVDILAGDDAALTRATIVAIDARVDPSTRNAIVRARIDGDAPAPGSSVRVRVPVGPPRVAVAIPVSALRQGPAGDHVFVLAPDDAGALRAHTRTVRAGAMLGDEVVIESGLEAGERVAASGSFKLRDAALVALADNPVQTAARGSR
jgi:membrane fusion protein (multidrug efflux system)